MEKDSTPVFSTLGDSAILITWDNTISLPLNQKVNALAGIIRQKPFIGFVDAVPAYCSLTVLYDVYRIKKLSSISCSVYDWVEQQVSALLSEIDPGAETSPFVIEIPVCYDEVLGNDLDAISKSTQLSKEEIIALHSSKQYHVYMPGFLPGFVYMGETDEQVAMPRKKEPVPVKAGAVGIAGRQTGIYPVDSPGGWNIAGYTPYKLFDPTSDKPCLLQPGDVVQFRSICIDDYYKMKADQHSMSITVIKSGISDTIQDAGRTGYAGFGINPSGAMDVLAMKTSNALAANDLNTPVIELHFPASSFRFNSDALIAIAGADFGAVIILKDDHQLKLDINKTALIKAGSVLSFTQKKWGERCYLSIHGSLQLPVWFGSHSTNLAIQQGGYKGRRLIKEDILELNKKLKSKVVATKVFPWLAGIIAWYGDMSTFNILPGPEWDYVDPFSKKHFLSKPFFVTPQSDRMGIRLEGNPIQRSNDEELVSSGVTFGTIQLLPNGQLIILMADHPTTGGYPRIANIISAHLPKLSQASPGTKLQFGSTDISKAEQSLFSQQQETHQLQMAVKLQLGAII